MPMVRNSRRTSLRSSDMILPSPSRNARPDVARVGDEKMQQEGGKAGREFGLTRRAPRIGLSHHLESPFLRSFRLRAFVLHFLLVATASCAHPTVGQRAMALARQHREEDGIAALRAAI